MTGHDQVRTTAAPGDPASRADPTIFALSSGQGPAGLAVIRVSGPAAARAIDLMAPPRAKPRFAALRHIVHPTTRVPIDSGLVLFFAAPRTETGEDMAEFHVHGGRAVIAATLAALADVPGCRLARPGEFARRAFANGKIDLTQVEGLADLIDAETEGQRRQALRQANGALAGLYRDWRSQAVAAMALVEAAIDFADEGDVASSSVEAARLAIAALCGEIQGHLADDRRGEIMREGFQVALVGPPNAGKSSLLNALARRDAAIVSADPGTTRDVLEVRLDLGGWPVVVADTAGLREAASPVEAEGVRRARARAAAADLVVWLVDGADPQPAGWDGIGQHASRLTVLNKADIAPPPSARTPAFDLSVSARTGEGIGTLVASIAERAGAQLTGLTEAPVLTQARHREALQAAVSHLHAFADGNADQLELRAEDLRRAAMALGRITGDVDPEEVLGAIFSRFCIGK